MAEVFDLIAEERTDSGKGASRRLRRAGKVPAIVYGAGRAPRAVCFEANPLLHKMENESFFSSVLTVNVGGKARQCILKDVQMHPAKRQVLHVDLQRIVADEKIKMTVPLHFLNEETAPGVKQSGGSVSHLVTEVEVSCFPADLPEYIELDIGEMELDDSLSMSDIKLPKGVELLDLTEENDPGVVAIHVIKAVQVEEEEGEEAEGGDTEAPASEEPKEGGDE